MEAPHSTKFRKRLETSKCDRVSLDYLNATQTAMAIYWNKMRVNKAKLSELLSPLRELGEIYPLYNSLVKLGASVAFPSIPFEILKERIQHALSHGTVANGQDYPDICMSVTCRLRIRPGLAKPFPTFSNLERIALSTSYWEEECEATIVEGYLC